MFVFPEGVEARCTQENPELWFSQYERDIQLAKRYCHNCPVQLACLEQAVDWEQLSGETLNGVVGGLTPKERNRLKIKQPA